MTLIFVILLIVLALLPLVLGIAIFFGQRKLMYPLTNIGGAEWEMPSTLPDGIEKISNSSSYSLFLNAATHPNDARPVLIVIHGNRETAFLWSGAVDPILNAGISVLLVEYPGYAGANGMPTYASMKAAAVESYDAIAHRSDVNADWIMAYGRSMGGGGAALLAEARPLAALGLESTFASMRQLAVEKRFPGFLLRDRYDNTTIVNGLDIPVFIYHGTEDTLIPIHHGLALVEVAKNPTLVTGPYSHSNGPRPWQELLAFIEAQTSIQLRQSVG